MSYNENSSYSEFEYIGNFKNKKPESYIFKSENTSTISNEYKNLIQNSELSKEEENNFNVTEKQDEDLIDNLFNNIQNENNYIEKFDFLENQNFIKNENEYKDLCNNILENKNPRIKKKKKNPIKEKKLNHLNQLNIFLIDLFCYNKYYDNNLSKIDKSIFNAILKRKFGVETNNLEKDEIEDLFLNSLKRKEENNKLIMKKSIKNLFEKYLITKKLKIKKLNKKEKLKNEINFYKFYFNDISINKKIPIESFYFPKAGTEKFRMKTFSNLYFINIKKSKDFKYELKQSIFDIFTNEKIIIRIKKKILNFLIILEEKLNNFDDLLNSIIKCSKIKIPWTFNEIENGKNICLKQLK